VANPKIEVVWNSQVVEIFGKDDVDGVKVKNLLSESLRRSTARLFRALGHVRTRRSSKARSRWTRRFRNREGQRSKTSLAGVFSAGRCADHVYQQAVTAAGMGARAAIDASRG
jgi:thioredoxin reductase (NADPH)